ncbi:lysophospholipid acyltransferase family protein [bacterium]|nr:lysophospholipid acyltransferase family protein [bacterium]
MKINRRAQKNFWENLGLSFFLWFFKTLSDKGVKRFMNFISVNIGYRIGIRKKLVIQQMKRALPGLSHQQVLDYTKRMYQHFGLMVYEIFKCDKDALVDNASIEGLDNIEEAISSGKSVLLATGHFGNWEMLGFYLLKRKIKLSAIAKKQRNPFFDEYFVQFRAKYGLDLIYQKGALKGILRAIKDNRMIFFLHDQDARKSGEIMPFMNHDASVFMGIAKIALKANLPIMPAYHIRTKEGKSIFRFEKIFYPSDENMTAFEVMDKLNNSLAEMITKYPELWFWVHKRWKSVERKKRNP